MIPSLPTSISLLERALGYTRDRLLGVTAGRLGDPTPCVGWDLHDLLVHMDDSLDAFLEAAGGEVGAAAASGRGRAPPTSAPGSRSRPARWPTSGGPRSATARQVVEVGGHRVPAVLLVNTAALEITVHGWDVGQATGDPERIPADLARHLHPVALGVVARADRGIRFGPPVGSLRTPHLTRPSWPIWAGSRVRPGRRGGIPPPGADAASYVSSCRRSVRDRSWRGR